MLSAGPHLGRVYNWFPDLKELHGGASIPQSVLHFSLFGEVVGALDGSDHPLHGEECCQIGGVGGDEDESEEPPDTSDDPATQGPEGETFTPIRHF